MYQLTLDGKTAADIDREIREQDPPRSVVADMLMECEGIFEETRAGRRLLKTLMDDCGIDAAALEAAFQRSLE
jgi:hypothetical protein